MGERDKKRDRGEKKMTARKRDRGGRERKIERDTGFERER